MTDSRMESDLGYVRDVLDRSEQNASPSSIYWLWAIIVLIGFPLADFAPRFVGLYWMIMGPLGGIASGILGYRFSRNLGQLSRRVGRQHALHWGAMMIVIFSAVGLGIAGTVAWSEIHRIILLILSLSYFLAGVYLEPPMIWIGLLMFAAYFVMFFMSAYAWTIVGIVVAAGMIVAAVTGGSGRGRQS